MLPAFQSTTTERLLLRAVRDSDLDAVFTLHADPETNRFTLAGHMRSRDEAHQKLALWLDDWARHGVGYWMVERRDAPGAVAGFGGVRHKVLEGRQVLNLAYRFLPQNWGTGYATEMARTALMLARRHVPDVPVVAVIHQENAASIRVAERSGMRFERAFNYEGMPSRLYVPVPA